LASASNVVNWVYKLKPNSWYPPGV
jgi:hypothetical protein